MSLSTLMHEPAQYTNYKDYFWPNNREIDQFLNQSSKSTWIIKCVTSSNHKSTLASISALKCMFPLKDLEHTFVEKEVHYVFDVQL